ncbi:GNAT family N-acetyltransferase [Sporolactobacillus sp. STSJ-5]|uniref:GNAT family N-acetyltransferase n=1 Tax=Sporolactobacillus sp. STSJ-5 TaxID=2965076 RepID=UPI002103C9DA|nr:GNAT family N-acetyltransferase [Sporolactobacillus sp. STSJ-5]MCQ2009974.1 GNAT family N-acetyltransferase [Sporolactobacillus sp. STSJ-5]
MTTYLRKATSHDFPEIKKIIDEAKLLLKADGIDQWQDGYPDDATLKEDIAQEISHVLIVDGRVAGTGVLFAKIEPAYEAIESGSWIQTSASSYASIHRVALSPDYRGRHLASSLMTFLITAAALNGHTDIRIDTHPENPRMQHVIKQAGFEYRGVVHLDMPNGKRWAYQLVLA